MTNLVLLLSLFKRWQESCCCSPYPTAAAAVANKKNAATRRRRRSCDDVNNSNIKTTTKISARKEAEDFFLHGLTTTTTTIMSNNNMDSSSGGATTTTTGTTTTMTTTTTTTTPAVGVSIHEDAIALLIQQLGAAFGSGDGGGGEKQDSSSGGGGGNKTKKKKFLLRCRLLALSYLTGAVEGSYNYYYHDSDNDETASCDATDDGRKKRGMMILSPKTTKLLGDFFLGHCGPILVVREEEEDDDRLVSMEDEDHKQENNNSMEDQDYMKKNYSDSRDDDDDDDDDDDMDLDEEEIRDMAMIGLTYLVKCCHCYFVVQEENHRHHDDNNATGAAVKMTSSSSAVEDLADMVLSLAQMGVEHRCAMPAEYNDDDDGDDDDDHYDNNSEDDEDDDSYGEDEDYDEYMEDYDEEEEENNVANKNNNTSNASSSKKGRRREATKGKTKKEDRNKKQHGHGDNGMMMTNNDGLSSLPRSRRSLCFDLLRSSVDVVQQQQQHRRRSGVIQRRMIRHTTFCLSCLPGELDPRCLIQIWDLFYVLIKACSPPSCYHQPNKNEDQQQVNEQTSYDNKEEKEDDDSLSLLLLFPIVDMFDACSIYYPIQFTPPPNNVHGITRQALHHALMNILCHLHLDNNNHNHHPPLTTTNKKKKKKKKMMNQQHEEEEEDSMLNLTFNLFLERLVPPLEDDNSNDDGQVALSDRLEALYDLRTLLLQQQQQPTRKQQTKQQVVEQPIIGRLSLEQIKKLSDAIIVVHEIASLSATPTAPNINDDEIKVAIQLAEACRKMVAAIALETEILLSCSSTSSGHGRLVVANTKTITKTHWDVFVNDTVQIMSSRLVSSPPSKVRTIIAYMACISSCGGIKTMRRCLSAGIKPLLNVIPTPSTSSWGDNDDDDDDDNDYNDINNHYDGSSMVYDEHDLSTAIYGIGAFFASCRAAMDTAVGGGGVGNVILHPHPLKEYSNLAIKKICQCFIFPYHNNDNNYDDNNHDNGDGSSHHHHRRRLLPYSAHQKSIMVKMACIRAMDSILLASPPNSDHNNNDNNSDEKQIETRIINFLKYLSNLILMKSRRRRTRRNDQVGNDDDNQENDNDEFCRACSRTLGSFLGRALLSKHRRKTTTTTATNQNVEKENVGDDDIVSTSGCILDSDRIQTLLLNKILSDLINSAVRTRSQADYNDGRGGDKSSSSRQQQQLDYDRIVLSHAAAYDFHAANYIVRRISILLYDTIIHNNNNDNDKKDNMRNAHADDTDNVVVTSTSCASALYALFLHKNGGPAATAYHETTTTTTSSSNSDDDDLTTQNNISSLDIITAFSVCKENSTISRLSLTDLELPKTPEENQILDVIINDAYNVIQLLLPSYDYPVSSLQHVKQLATIVNNVIPPLTDADTIKLSVTLPFLSAALENTMMKMITTTTTTKSSSTCTPTIPSPSDSDSDDSIDRDKINNILRSMVVDLTNFALTLDHHSSARSYAARCLYSTLVMLKKDKGGRGGECSIDSLIEVAVLPAMLSSLHEAVTNNNKKDDNTATLAAAAAGRSGLADCFSILATLGAAAAGRCGDTMSKKTAESVAIFLVKLACNKVASFDRSSGAGGVRQIIDLKRIDDDRCCPINNNNNNSHSRLARRSASTELSVVAASAFGTMLSSQSGDAIWKQRIIHRAMKIIIQEFGRRSGVDTTTTIPSNIDDRHVSLGMLAVGCHIVCSSSIRSMGSKLVHDITLLMIHGLSARGPLLREAARVDDGKVLKLFLVSMIKLLSSVPDAFFNDDDDNKSSNTTIHAIVVGSLRAYAYAGQAPTTTTGSKTGCKLLALQILEIVATTNNTSMMDTMMAKVKPAVVSILGAAMDEPSGLLRQAAVEVRNAWFLLEPKR